MKTLSILVLPLTLLFFSGCAADISRDAAGRPNLERLSQPTAPSASEQLSLADLVALEKRGERPREIVARLQASGQRIAFDGAQQRRLSELGGSAALSEALSQAEAQAKETDRLTAESDRLAQQRARAEQARQSAPYPYYPYYYDRYPYYSGYPSAYFGYRSGYRHRGFSSGVLWAW